MCFRNKLTEALKAKSPRSPFRRHYREPIRPRLPRRIVPSARVNLNAYWSQFEELSKSSVLTYDLSNTGDRFSSSMYQDNEINDNLLNELMELGNK
ncbi:hypothetical protein NQ315_005805 [Exocentrus adspersus]|uniref:Uncharacterized protein n=1 Tax=Exocentrus adspersus TaxID=1586481 RepID=A0AAV8VRP5_9CUCU|nr:hypothetical protein NQ315_005805 [Exocentrus adspersus]